MYFTCSVLQGLTIDVIGTCAFGLEPQFQKNRDEDPFIIRCQRLFTDFAKRPFIVILGGKFYYLCFLSLLNNLFKLIFQYVNG